jgi:hypothetical protein
MANLSDARSIKVATKIMSDLSSIHEGLGGVREDMVAAVPYCDNWIETNAAGVFGTAFPEPANSLYTPDQKLRIIREILNEHFSGSEQ